MTRSSLVLGAAFALLFVIVPLRYLNANPHDVKLFFSDSGVSAQSHSVPYNRDLGPSLHVMSLNYSYPTSYERIEDVDFQNLTLQVFDEQGKPEAKLKLKNGSYEDRDNAGFETVKLDSIYYLAEDSNRRYAAVLYAWSFGGGSSNDAGIAQVFELLDHRLTLKQQLEWDKHFDTSKPYASFNENSRTLVVRTAHYLPGDAHCCVSATDVVTMRWNGNRFTQKAVRTELSDYGLSIGKKI
jgi:hypothetical protein